MHVGNPFLQVPHSIFHPSSIHQKLLSRWSINANHAQMSLHIETQPPETQLRCAEPSVQLKHSTASSSGNISREGFTLKPDSRNTINYISGSGLHRLSAPDHTTNCQPLRSKCELHPSMPESNGCHSHAAAAHVCKQAVLHIHAFYDDKR